MKIFLKSLMKQVKKDYAKKAFDFKDEVKWLFEHSKYEARMKYDEQELLTFLIDKII